VRGGSDQRHGFGWTIEAARIGVSQCDQGRRRDANAQGAGERDVGDIRQGTCQRMESAALIMHIQNAVMMIGTRGSGRKVATIAGGLSRVEYIQRVFVDQPPSMDKGRQVPPVLCGKPFCFP
jgi:hypothetical protein